ncbi:MAG: cytochrome c [Burkholderiales bacterium]|nr:cytochrome c [Burkholderiales bacterium]
MLALAFPACAGGSEEAMGKTIFTKTAQPSCTLCHALKDAGSSAEIGPNLDELKPDAERVAKAVKDGLGIMPAFGESLSDEQIKAVAHYVARATGAAK